MPVSDIIGEGLIAQADNENGWGKASVRDARIGEYLEAVGLRKDYARRFPHEFSGGQRQRIGIARALVLEPDFIVCDEPVSALDVSIQSQILNLLLDLRERFDLTYLFIAHNLSVVQYISDRVGVMYLGKIVELATVEALYAKPSHPYTVALLSAVPEPDPRRRKRRIVLKGDLPSPAAPPSGCRFHTRCWLREQLGNPERCATEDPELRVTSAGYPRSRATSRRRSRTCASRTRLPERPRPHSWRTSTTSMRTRRSPEASDPGGRRSGWPVGGTDGRGRQVRGRSAASWALTGTWWASIAVGSGRPPRGRTDPRLVRTERRAPWRGIRARSTPRSDRRPRCVAAMSRSSGRSVAHTAGESRRVRSQQRGWKVQPDGRVQRAGHVARQDDALAPPRVGVRAAGWRT